MRAEHAVSGVFAVITSPARENPPVRLTLEAFQLEVSGRILLRDTALDVAPGEAVALIGANGMGKTTLLRSLFRAATPTRGRVLHDGKDLRSFSLAEIAATLGYVPQTIERLPPYTVGEFAAVLVHGVARDRADTGLVARVLEDAELPAAIAASPLRSLSGGERQKLLLACATAHRPGLLLLDEPTSFLDAKNQRRFTAKLSALASSGRVTTIVASHDPELVAEVAHRVVRIDDARLVEIRDRAEARRILEGPGR